MTVNSKPILGRTLYGLPVYIAAMSPALCVNQLNLELAQW